MSIERPRPMIKKAVRTRAVAKGKPVKAGEKSEPPAWKKSLEAGIRAGKRKPVRTLSVKEKERLQEIEREHEENYARISCAFCKGTGIDPYGLSPLSKCVACSGKGYAFVKKPYEKCGACAGRGQYIATHMYCWICKGKGVVSKEEICP